MAFDNESGKISRKSKRRNDDIIASLSSRGMGDSQTSRAILAMRNQQEADMREIRAVNKSNKMRDVERRSEEMLGQRSFGYARHDTYVPAADFTDYGGAAKSAMMAGIVKTGMATWQGAKQDAFQKKQEAIMKQQGSYYDRLLGSSQIDSGTLDWATNLGYGV